MLISMENLVLNVMTCMIVLNVSFMPHDTFIKISSTLNFISKKYCPINCLTPEWFAIAKICCKQMALSLWVAEFYAFMFFLTRRTNQSLALTTRFFSWVFSLDKGEEIELITRNTLIVVLKSYNVHMGIYMAPTVGSASQLGASQKVQKYQIWIPSYLNSL